MLSNRPKFEPKMMKDPTLNEGTGGLRNPTAKELKTQYEIFKRDILHITEDDEIKEKEIVDEAKLGQKRFIIINVLIIAITLIALLWGVTADLNLEPASVKSIPVQPTFTPLAINFQADETREYNVLFSKWENNNAFKWEIENVDIGTTILTIFDPAGVNPALPYFLQIDNNTQEVVQSATIIDCFRCNITSVHKNNQGDFTFAILNNGIYEINTETNTKRKIAFPGLTRVFDYNGQILTTIINNDLVQIDTQTNEIIFKFFLANNPSENIKQIKFRSPDLIDLLSQSPPGIITISTSLSEQERAITNLRLKKPISFIEFGTQIWIYDIENREISILDSTGKEINSITTLNNIPLGESLQSQLLKGLKSEIIVQDPSNNRLVYLDAKSLKVTNSIQAFGHIINGSSQSVN